MFFRRLFLFFILADFYHQQKSNLCGNFVSIIFCVKFLLPLYIIFTIAIRPVLPVLSYAVNYEYIVKNECINKAKPQQTCNGRCFLEKELAKTEKQSQQITTKSNFIDFFLTNEILLSPTALPQCIVELLHFSELKNQHLSSFTDDIFHPPLV